MDVSTVPCKHFRAILWVRDWMTLNVILFYISSAVDHVDFKEGNSYVHFFYFFNLSWLVSVYLTSYYLNKLWLSFEISLKNAEPSFFLTSLAVLGFVFFLKYHFSRLFVTSCLAFFGLMLFVNRAIFRLLVRKAKIWLSKKVVILGSNEVSSKLMSYFKRQSQFTTVVGYFSDTQVSLDSEDIFVHQPIWLQDGHWTRSNVQSAK